MKTKLYFAFLIMFIFSCLDIYASTYNWFAKVNKKEAYINEAIHLKYVCEFNDEANLYAIDFNPIGSYENYDLLLLSEEERIHNNKRINNFEFIVYAKKAGDIEFNFEVVMKKTTRLSIENTVLGRDNMEKEQYSKTPFKLKVLNVKIKDINTKLVGNFKINLKKDNTNKKAYEPFHMELIINGHGDFQKLKAVEFNIENVKVFSQKPVVKTLLTKDGYSGVWSQKFAFVGKKDFVIPSFRVEYTNPKTKIEEDYVSGDIAINILSGYKKTELLDKEEKRFEFSFDFVYYILIMIAGFLLGKIKFKLNFNDSKSDFMKKVQNTKSIDKILIILILENKNKYNIIIKDIESKNIVSLEKIKMSIKDLKH